MPKLHIKPAPELVKTRIELPKNLAIAVRDLAVKAKTSSDDVVAQCLAFSLRQIQTEPK